MDQDHLLRSTQPPGFSRSPIQTVGFFSALSQNKGTGKEGGKERDALGRAAGCAVLRRKIPCKPVPQDSGFGEQRNSYGTRSITVPLLPNTQLAEEIGISSAKVSQLKRVSIRPASLDAPIGDDDSTAFGEIVGDEDAQTPFELLRDKNLRDQVRELLEVLDDRERKIIFQRFGLDGANPKTLEVIGKKFGVTRERIRQLQNVALDKLRRALRKKETPQAAPVVATGAPFACLRPKLHTARPKLPCIWYLSPR